MRKLVYFVAASIDGYIAGPEGQTDFFPMAGDHIAAQVAELPETLPRHLRSVLGASEQAARFDTVVMGWGTYAPAYDQGITEPYAPLETVVFSRRRRSQQHGALRITPENPVDVVRELKAQPGRDIWLCGGGKLASALVDELDELVLKVNPVIVGDGVRVMEGGFHPRTLVRESRRDFESGVTWLTCTFDR